MPDVYFLTPTPKQISVHSIGYGANAKANKEALLRQIGAAMLKVAQVCTHGLRCRMASINSGSFLSWSAHHEHPQFNPQVPADRLFMSFEDVDKDFWGFNNDLFSTIFG